MSNCKIIIKDEVNIKIDGLDLDTRKDLVKKFKIVDPTARFRPSYRLGRWDGTVSFFGIGGTTYLNMLDKILVELENRNYYIEVEDLRESPPLEFDKITEEFWGDKCWPKGHRFEGEPIRLRDDQVEVVNTFLANPQALQEVATGAGKCQPLTSKVLTPTGWKTMEEITVGSLVMTPTGKSVTVLNTFEPGVKDIYEFTFDDGRTARCCGDHIWKIYNIDWKRSKTGVWRHLTTTDIIELHNNTKRTIGIPLVTMSEDNTDIDLPMDPWLIGFLLGDGSFRNNKVSFSTSDDELVEKVRSKLLPEYCVKYSTRYDYSIKFTDSKISQTAHGKNMSEKNRNFLGHILPNQKSSSHHYVKTLMDLELMETYSHTKFIPEIYFSGSYEQRMELIRGLVDSDGTIDKSSVVYTSTSKELATGFQRLIHSVGGIAKLKHCPDRSYNYNDVRTLCKDVYHVSTKFPEPWKLTSLKRKIDKTNHYYQYGPTLKLNIKNIKKVSTEQVKCIYIDDADHLYVTDNYIVTHNTIMTATLSKICEKYGRTITIVPNKSLVEQTEEDFINVGLDVGVYYGDRKDLNKTHTICTWQSLNILDKKSKNFDESNEVLTLAGFLESVSTVIVDECFDGSTLIETPNGKIPIKELKVGDKIINLDEDSLTYKEDTIVKVHKNLMNGLSEQMLELEFDNGSTIRCTANHKFLTTAGWVRADELTDDLEIIDVNTYN